MCQLMTENTVKLLPEKNSMCLLGTYVYMLWSAWPRALPDCCSAHYIITPNLTGECDSRGPVARWIWQSVHLCTGYFLYSWEAKLHQYYVYPDKLNTHAFIWDRCWRCLVVLQAPDFVNHKLDGWRQDKRISGLLLRVRDEACLWQRTCPSSPGNWSAFVLELSSIQE